MTTFDVKVDASRANLRLEQLTPELRDALTLVVTLAAGELQGAAQANASGDLLQVRSGKFLKSIKAGVSSGKKSVTGRVYTRDPRARLFEYGGHTPPHDILPKNTKALLLQMRGGNVFAGGVHHPGGQYAARDIIHSAFEEMLPDIVASLENAVRDAAAQASD